MNIGFVFYKIIHPHKNIRFAEIKFKQIATKLLQQKLKNKNKTKKITIGEFLLNVSKII